jgi:hypothetical protein
MTNLKTAMQKRESEKVGKFLPLQTSALSRFRTFPLNHIDLAFGFYHLIFKQRHYAVKN